MATEREFAPGGTSVSLTTTGSSIRSDNEKMKTDPVSFRPCSDTLKWLLLFNSIKFLFKIIFKALFFYRWYKNFKMIEWLENEQLNR